ncbi:ubiquinone anaerobic biosynthesis accessory factor UbiT [Profundibacter sp.]
MNNAGAIPIFPSPLARAIGALPLGPLSLSLTAYARRIARTHPAMFRRLGEYGNASFALDPTDLPFVINLAPRGGNPEIKVTRNPVTVDARIAGPLAALLGLMHGAYDGDALFFSRDLVIEGDTSATLALRNAVDDAELDLADEVSAISGPLAAPVTRLIALAERHTGVSLSRPEELAW